MEFLDSSIQYLPGVGERRAALLGQELNIRTMRDLLYHFPFRYIDRTHVYRISEITDDTAAYVQFRARIDNISIQGSGRKKRLVAIVSDGGHSAELVWFSGITWQQKRLEPGREYMVFGRPGFFNGMLSVVHPEVESLAGSVNRTSAIQGVYRTTEKLSSNQLGTKSLYKLICGLWETVGNKLTDTLPEYLVKRYGLMPLREAIRTMHFPDSPEHLKAAQYRLKFEELLGIQLGVLEQRSGRLSRNDGFTFPQVGELFNTFYHGHLPFELTGAQKRVIREIRSDTVTGHQMNRLLQGDVGSGKTLVALMSMLLAVDNGFQACLMAPTEILARQHLATICDLLDEMPVRVEILTGATTASDRKRILPDVASGTTNILIGTHALIEDGVQFSNLGFVVIDEQHRFGVEQRARLWGKNAGRPPHILVMTATPIPRTLAMTLYGDLDVSVIDELPPGRKPVLTRHSYDSQRLAMFGFLRKQIAAGRQIYVVYPLIHGSEKMDYKDLKDGLESLSREFPMPQYRIVEVHGRMKAHEKEEAMALFKSGQAQIMVATSVIEVGVDVPNATVMVIESAERFGLSQLHQLRGRVGRGGDQSYCILMSGDRLSTDARKRLEAMVQTVDGFELSELDLRLRGSGDLSGTQQSGLAFELKIANLSRDNEVLEAARMAATAILEIDPMLTSAENRLLLTLKNRTFPKKDKDFSMIS